MASRSRSDSTELQTYIQAAQTELVVLTEQSSKEFITATMEIEMQRLKRFVINNATAADAILDAGIVPQLMVEASYFPPPLARPKIKLRPTEEFFIRNAPKSLVNHPQFSRELVVPGFGFCAGLEIGASFILPYAPNIQSAIDLEFEVNYEQTIQAFRWLFQQWRRPLCQLLRGLPDLELWGNGISLDPPKGSHTKDPGVLLERHLNTRHERPEDNLVSLRSSFTADDVDSEVTNAFAVFLALFDSIYHLNADRANPDRLLRHYESLISRLPKPPFRKTSIFSVQTRTTF